MKKPDIGAKESKAQYESFTWCSTTSLAYEQSRIKENISEEEPKIRILK